MPTYIIPCNENYEFGNIPSTVKSFCAVFKQDKISISFDEIKISPQQWNILQTSYSHYSKQLLERFSPQIKFCLRVTKIFLRFLQ